MSRSPTTTEDGLLHNSAAGELLLSEFMQPLGLSAGSLAEAIGVSAERVDAVIEGKAAFDAELDLRLTRYFGLSEGYFLRLQLRYELIDAKRALNGKLDRIIPRAA